MKFSNSQLCTYGLAGAILPLMLVWGCSDDKANTGENCVASYEAAYTCSEARAQATGDTAPDFNDASVAQTCQSQPACMDEYYDCVAAAYNQYDCGTDLGVENSNAAIAQCAADMAEKDSEECSEGSVLDAQNDMTEQSFGEDVSTDTSTGNSDAESSCPDFVPEKYKFLWDCTGGVCDTGTVLYRHGVGQSFADGTFEVEENWYLFGPGTECKDTFIVSGTSQSINPDTFGCGFCEQIFRVNWVYQETSNCNINWTSFFADQESEEQNYFGYIMFDTHTTLTGERNPDNAMSVVAAPVNGNNYAPNNDYAKGTAFPTSDVDGIPEEYEWVNTGDCLGG